MRVTRWASGKGLGGFVVCGVHIQMISECGVEDTWLQLPVEWRLTPRCYRCSQRIAVAYTPAERGVMQHIMGDLKGEE